MKLAIVDHSTSPLHQSDLQAMAHALFCQLHEIALVWNVIPPESVDVVPLPQGDDGSGELLGEDTWELAIWDTSDAPGDAGYHTTDPRGKPYGKVFRDAVDCILNTQNGGRFPLVSVLSHEAAELHNRYANLYALRADGRTLDALELCDAVEDVWYDDPEGTGCLLSNYLFPSAFDPGAMGPYDRQGVLKNASDTTPGGYRIVGVLDPVTTGGAAFRMIAVYGPNHAMAQNGDALAMARKAAKTHVNGAAARRSVAMWVGAEHFDRFMEENFASAETVKRDTLPPEPQEKVMDSLAFRPLDASETVRLRARIHETLRRGEVAPPIPEPNRVVLNPTRGALVTPSSPENFTPGRKPSTVREMPPMVGAQKGLLRGAEIRGPRPSNIGNRSVVTPAIPMVMTTSRSSAKTPMARVSPMPIGPTRPNVRAIAVAMREAVEMVPERVQTVEELLETLQAEVPTRAEPTKPKGG